MKRTLLFASLLGLGFTLFGQNATANDQVTRDGQNTVPARGPNARVTVTPGPQGLPTVDAAAWSSIPGEEDLNLWLNGVRQEEAQDSPPANPRPPEGRRVFEPPPMGGLPSFTAPRPAGSPAASMGPDMVTPNPQARREPPNSSSSPEPVPAGETGARQEEAESSGGRQNGGSGGGPLSQRPAEEDRFLSQAPPGGQDRRSPPAARAGGQGPGKAPGDRAPGNVVVVPSPVHYDRAGRRVIDPGWQETMYRMIQAREEESAGEEPAGPEAGEEEVRERVILVPGPALWRIRGTLTVAKGMLALEDAGGVLWYLPGLDRYIGYIEGLDAGEEAVLEGYAPPRGSSQERYFQPVKLFIDEMEYDLAIPPEGLYLGGQTTIIREIERRDRASPEPRGRADPPGRGGFEDDAEEDGPDDWEPPVRRREAPAREPRRRSPWAPPAGVFDLERDNGSFWREDPAKQERRERDSREIWY